MSRTSVAVIAGCVALGWALLVARVYVPGSLCAVDGPDPLWCTFAHTIMSLVASIVPSYLVGRIVGHRGLALGFAVGFAAFLLFAVPDFVREWEQWDWRVYAYFLWSGAENPGALAAL